MAVKYSLVEAEGKEFFEDHWAVKIEEGSLEGLLFQYDTVGIKESEDGDGAVLEFNTVTLEEPTNPVNLTEDEEKNILGDILVDILQEQIENANGTPDTEQPTT